MKPDRFIHHDVSSLGIEANVGIQLLPKRNELIVVPRSHLDADDAAPPPFVFPQLPAMMLEEKARLLRRLCHSGRWGMWTLYLDCQPTNRWRAYLPPQLCTIDDRIRANLAYPGGEVPGPQLRLAGTLRSAPLLSPGQLAAELPPIDGLHIYCHFENWLLLSVFVMIDKVARPMSPHNVVADSIDLETMTLAGCLWGVSPT